LAFPYGSAGIINRVLTRKRLGMEKRSALKENKEKKQPAVVVVETKKKISGSEVIIGQLIPKRLAEGGKK